MPGLKPDPTGQLAAVGDAPGVVKRWGVLAAVSLATLMMLLDFMAVAVALPAVHRSLDASFPQLEWVLEAFVLTLAALVLTAGRISDVVGRRPAFLWGLVVFGVGSLLAGVAQTPYTLIGARVVQGIGGALLFATGPVLLTETFRERGRAAVAVWGTVTGVAVASSPIVGGEIASTLGWRWLFFLEVPVSALALVIGFIAVREPAARQGDATPSSARTTRRLAETGGNERRVPIVDRRGVVLFTAAIVIVVIGVVRSTTAVEGFSQNGVVACFIMTGLLLIGFVASETVAPTPMLDVSLFRRRTFTGSSIAAFGLSMAVLGPVLCLVFYMSFDQGDSELTIGTHLLLLTVVTLAFLPLTGFLDKYVPVRLLICSGLLLVAVGLWLISRLSSAGTLSELVPGLIVAGVGLELVNPRLASAAAATVQAPAAAIASRTISTLRQLGTATGVAVFGAIFITQLSDHISNRAAGFSQLANENPTIASLVIDGHTAQALSSAPAAVRTQILPIIQAGFASAIHDVFLVAAVVALASAALALLTRSSDVPRIEARELRTEASGTQGSASEKSGNGIAAGRAAAPVARTALAARTAAPSPNGDRHEQPAPTSPTYATPAYATSAAATLAALGITVEPPPVPEVTIIGEIDIPGELAKLRELAAPDLDAPPSNGAHPDLAADAPAQDADVVEPDVEEAPDLEPEVVEAPDLEPEVVEAPDLEPEVVEEPAASIATAAAVGAWPGWPGWEAPDEEAPEDTAEPEGTVEPEGTAQPEGTVEPEGTAQPEGTEEAVTVADFLSYWHLAETPGPGTANGSVVAQTGPEDGVEVKTELEAGGVGAGTRPEVAGVGAETKPEVAGSPDAPTIGRRWVRGQVTATTGEPLAGALVTLVNSEGDEAGHAIAGSDGSFAVGDMWEGNYTLIAAAPHFRPGASTLAVQSEGAHAALSLVGIGSLAGKVTTAKDGQPMSVDIELFSPDEGVSAQGRTGKDGCFLLSDVPDGAYELVARSAGYRTEEVPVVVERAETVTIGVVMVGLGHLYGAVTGPGGEWVPRAELALTDRTGSVVATTWSDGAGSYRFADIPEGTYSVHAAAFDAACPVVEVEAGSTVAADVTLASP
jgi:MFS family permease